MPGNSSKRQRMSESIEISSTPQLVKIDFEAFPFQKSDQPVMEQLISSTFNPDIFDIPSLSSLICQSQVGFALKVQDWQEDDENVIFSYLCLFDLDDPQAASLKEKIISYAGEFVSGGRVGVVVTCGIMPVPGDLVGPAFRSLREDLKLVDGLEKILYVKGKEDLGFGDGLVSGCVVQDDREGVSLLYSFFDFAGFVTLVNELSL